MRVTLLRRRKMEIEYAGQVMRWSSGDQEYVQVERKGAAEIYGKDAIPSSNAPPTSPKVKVPRKRFAWLRRFFKLIKPRKRSKTAPSPAPNNTQPKAQMRRPSQPQGQKLLKRRALSTIVEVFGEKSRPSLASSQQTLSSGDEREKETGSFFAEYKLVKPVNEGTFSKVYAARHKLTGEIVAVKKVDKQAVKEEIRGTYTEIQALKKLQHPYICKLYQIFETDRLILLVLEKCNGDLFEIIHKSKRIKEKRARKIFTQVVVAVEYIHRKGFAHRDLKPENVLFDVNGDVKLIDFNLSAGIYFNGSFGWNKLHTHCGTIEYAAPELLRPDEHYEGPPVDSWCLGVMLYTMLVGRFPFEDDNQAVQRTKILNCVYNLPPHLSKDSRRLIMHLLQVNPRCRLTPTQILKHVWLTTRPPGNNKGGNNERRIRGEENERDFDLEVIKVMSTVMTRGVKQLQENLTQLDYNSKELALYNIVERKREIMGEEKFRQWATVWRREVFLRGRVANGGARGVKQILLQHQE